MGEFDTIIRGGTIIDGRNFPRYRADIGITDGRIAKIGRLDDSTASEEIDATGLIVAPGFIDTHTHYDAQLFWDPYLTLSGWHGVTSVVIGNCGFGFAPARKQDQEYLMRALTRVEAISYDAIKMTMPWSWESFPEWLDALDKTPKGLNLLASVPLNPLMVYVMGDDAKRRDPTAEEMARMEELLHEAMEAGACGWSAQMQRPDSGTDNQRDHDGTSFPTDLMSDETVFAFSRVMRSYDRGFIQTTASDNNWDRMTKKVEGMADAAQRPVLWNAIAGDGRHPGMHLKLIEWVRSCQERSLPVWGQAVTSGNMFIFTLEDWNMYDDSPAWRNATLGTPAERLEKFKDPAVRQAIKDNPTTRGYQHLAIIETMSERFKPIEGTLLPQATKIMGYDDQIDLLIDLIIEDELKTVFQNPELNDDPEAQAEVATAPYTLWGVSDGGAHTKFLTLGAYPTEGIIEFTRDRQIVTLEEAHWRLSSLPAECLGLRDRGTLVEGAAADIVVYDYDNLTITPEEVVHDIPGGDWRRIRRANGYRYTLVNGHVIAKDGEFTGVHSGELIRQGGGQKIAA